jgi:hypothetical protein
MVVTHSKEKVTAEGNKSLLDISKYKKVAVSKL